MHPNEQLLHQFYQAFAKLDYATMQEAYTDDALFYDPIFEGLDASQTRSMWHMLCKNARGFSLTFKNVIADVDYGSCDWVADYIFSATGRRVVNKVHSHFRCHDGKILEQQDNFKLYPWCRQALGLPGTLFGWSSIMQNKVKKKARNNLHNFMRIKENLT